MGNLSSVMLSFLLLFFQEAVYDVGIIDLKILVYPTHIFFTTVMLFETSNKIGI